MKNYLLLCLLLLLFSCKKETTVSISFLIVRSGVDDLPLNEYGKAFLQAEGDGALDLSTETEFYANDQKITGNIFEPAGTGIFHIKGIYKGVESNEIEIKVSPPLNKKILLEYYTNVGCGWCPWMGFRVDSLHKANSKVIGYTIHGDDVLEVPGVQDFQVYQHIVGRPTVRINRGYARNFWPVGEIAGLRDSISFMLSQQPPLELAIESSLNGDELHVVVRGKIYKPLQGPLYLTLIAVEDGLITHNQANLFSNQASYANCPFTSQPNPIPEYENHNVLRMFISAYNGDLVLNTPLTPDQEPTLGAYDLTLENVTDPQSAFLIAFVHTRRVDAEISSVLNAQIVALGHAVGFKE